MRLVFLLVGGVFLLTGLVFGALNAAPVAVNLYFLQFELALGVALLGAALLGAVLGGLVLLLSVIWPLRRRLRQLRRAAESPATETA
jgi:lipopolysaccharide assembly protein A